MCAILFLTACASKSLLSEVTSAVFFDKFPFDSPGIAEAKLNPSYQYLHVTLGNSKPALLVLGYVDAHPQGNIEVWYSGLGEVLRLQNGRLVGASGLPVEWRRVTYSETPPDWNSVSAAGVQYARIRDEYPGYKLGLMDQVFSTHMKKPPDDFLSDAPADVSWYQERYSDAGGTSIPAAWFALGNYGGQKTIVYSRQCLSVNVCLTLKRWPLQKDIL